jgi:hypothetical protein
MVYIVYILYTLILTARRRILVKWCRPDVDLGSGDDISVPCYVHGHYSLHDHTNDRVIVIIDPMH